MTAAGKLASRHSHAELVRLEADLTANRANRLPNGSLRPSVARKVRNLRLAIQHIEDDRQPAARNSFTQYRRNHS